MHGYYRAVLFDFFGTLSRAVRSERRQIVADALGCPLDRLTTVLAESFYDRARGRYGDEVSTMRWLAGELGLQLDDEGVLRAVRARQRVAVESMRLRAEAVEVLAALRQRRFLIGVVSDCTHELAACWTRLSVAPLVDAAAFSIELGVCKPDPQIYRAAIDALGVAPGECLYVGDGASRELSGAAALGMDAVRLVATDSARHHAYQRDELWTGPEIRQLAEVLELLPQAAVRRPTPEPPDRTPNLKRLLT